MEPYLEKPELTKLARAFCFSVGKEFRNIGNHLASSNYPANLRLVDQCEGKTERINMRSCEQIL